MTKEDHWVIWNFQNQYHMEPSSYFREGFNREDYPAFCNELQNSGFVAWSLGPDRDLTGSQLYRGSNGLRSIGDLLRPIAGDLPSYAR